MSQKIAVLAGGPSCERNISLISGKAVFDALKSKGISAVLIDPVGDFIGTLKRENISFVFLALHGTFGEDGTVQRLLDKEGIGYTGSGPRASEWAFDKSKAQKIFKDAGLRIPEFHLLKKGESLKSEGHFSWPLVVKPSASGSSVGISIVSDKKDYERACLEAFKYSDTVLIEQYIEGRELTVSILNGRALPIVEIIVRRKFYDYEAKYKDAGTVYEVPAKLTAAEEMEIKEIALKAYEALGCDIMARVDILLDRQSKPYVLEVNTIPGLTGKSLLPKAAKSDGLEFPDLCVKIIELSMQRVLSYGQAG